MREKLKNSIEEILGREVTLVHPKDLKNGDYSLIVDTETAEEDFQKLESSKLEYVERIEFVKPRFINIYLSKDFFKKSLGEIIEKGGSFGRGEHAKGFKVMVEHTALNPFKQFHIGHMMPNVIGSTISRIFEWNGAEVKQVNYQGDKGMHVAEAVWAVLNGKAELEPIGNAYVVGNKAYQEDGAAKKEIEEINKKLYDNSDSSVTKTYEEGRKKSLEYFENIYQKLGSKFDYYFFESETAPIGKEIVNENIGKVFEESEGAVVFKGSHTRVFINSKGIPTYEAKDLGNAKNKYDKYPYDLSVVVTGNEIKEYFHVVLEAMSKVLPELAQKTKHLSHGMLRLPTGKMSSRTGDVITAESLIEQVKERVKGDERVAIGAIKYMILRQSIGGDIVFDIEKSVSTEGDSGVYLQYAYARAGSVLEKTGNLGILSYPTTDNQQPTTIERLLYRFPEIVKRAGKDYAPNYITTYLTELAGSFNSFYAQEQILGDDYRLAITSAFRTVMGNGLNLLGIPAPEKM